jgi:hypothetical protein
VENLLRSVFRWVLLVAWLPSIWGESPEHPQGAEPDAAPEVAPAPWVESATAERIQGVVAVVSIAYPPDSQAHEKRDAAATRVQPGVLVGPDTVVTNLAALQGSKLDDLRVNLHGEPPLRAQVLGGDPALDLVVLRIDEPRARAGVLPTRTPLVEDAALVPLSREAWTLHLDPRAPQTARPQRNGELESTASRAGQQPHLRELAPAGTPWTLGGLPIVDGEGRLAGIWTWTAPGAPLEVRTAGEVRALVERCVQRTPRAGEEWIRSLSGVAPRSYPLLAWSSRSKLPKGAAEDLIEQVRCPECAGRGYKVTERETEGRGGVRGRQRIEVECPDCKRGRIGPANRFWTATRNLAARVTACNDPAARAAGFDQFEEALEESIRDVAALHPVEVRRRFGDGAFEELNPDKLVPGRSLAFLVHAASWEGKALPGVGIDARLVHNPGYPPLVFIDRRQRNVLGESCDALVFGAVAGTIRLGDETCVVIERSLTVPIARPGADAPR